MTKEDLRKDFNTTLKNIVDKFKNQSSNLVDGKTLNDHVFDWFYNEVDVRDKELARWKSKYNAIATGCEAKISHLESLAVAAEEVEQATHKLMSGLAKDGTAIDGFTDAWNKSLTYRKLKLEYQISIHSPLGCHSVGEGGDGRGGLRVYRDQKDYCKYDS